MFQIAFLDLHAGEGILARHAHVQRLRLPHYAYMLVDLRRVDVGVLLQLLSCILLTSLVDVRMKSEEVRGKCQRTCKTLAGPLLESTHALVAVDWVALHLHGTGNPYVLKLCPIRPVCLEQPLPPSTKSHHPIKSLPAM